MAFVKEMEGKLLIDNQHSIWFCKKDRICWAFSMSNTLNYVHWDTVGKLGVDEFIIGPACLAQW